MNDTTAAAVQTITVVDATINATIKGLLKGRGFDNPNELAAYVGVTPATIYNHLNGTPWKAWEVARAAAFFDVPLERIYDGLGGTFVPDPSLRGGKPTLTPVPSPAKRRSRQVTERYRHGHARVTQPPLLLLHCQVA